jgi:hypothetical protein
MSKRLSTLKMEEVSGVDDPANMLPGWMVTKARAQSGGSQRFLAVVKTAIFLTAHDTSELAVFDGAESIHVLKAKHDGRQHPDTGRFTPMSAPRQTKVAPGVVVTHDDTRQSLAQRIVATWGKRDPADNGADSASAYDNETRHPVHSGDLGGAPF